MRVVVKRPGAPAYIDSVGSVRRCLAELLGTSAQCFKTGPLRPGTLVAWCDDDGWSKNLPINLARPTDGAEIRGPIVITGIRHTKDGPDAASLTEAEAREALELLAAIGVES